MVIQEIERRFAGRDVRIVLVEDNPDVCQALRGALALYGHEVQGYLTGTSAIAAVQAGIQCDLLMTDYYVPDLVGTGIVRRIRKVSRWMPAIVLTASRERSVAIEVAGLDNCVLAHKPIEIDQLNELIASIATREVILAAKRRSSGR